MKKPFFFILLISYYCFVQILLAQTRIWSPYSRYGIGELNFVNSTFLGSMGNTSIAFNSNSIINVNNPASYVAADSMSFLFDGGAMAKYNTIKQAENKENSVYSSLSHIIFAFPATQKISFSFGLMPYSSMGYKISDQEIIDSIGKVNYTYDGWGGLNKLYVGSGMELFQNFSVGINANYIFGSLNRQQIAVFDSANFFNSRIRNHTIVNDFNFDLGLQYYFNLKNDKRLMFGVVYGLPADLSVKNTKIAERFIGNSGIVIIKDTIEYSKNNKGHISFPMHYGAGIGYEKKNHWYVGFDANWQQWSDYKFMGKSDSLNNSIRYSAGGYYIPKSKTGVRNQFTNTTFLWGLHYYQSNLELRNNIIKQRGISFGVRLPLKQSRSSVMLSLELGKTGTTDENLIEETYLVFKVSMNIYEIWFFKRKYE